MYPTVPAPVNQGVANVADGLFITNVSYFIYCSIPDRVEISNGGADVREKWFRVPPDQPWQGTGTSSDRARSAGGSPGRTRVEPSTLARGIRSDNAPVRIVTLTVTTLSSVDSLLTESQKWSSENLINRQILMDEGPWRGADMIVAWELYFQGGIR